MVPGRPGRRPRRGLGLSSKTGPQLRQGGAPNLSRGGGPTVAGASDVSRRGGRSGSGACIMVGANTEPQQNMGKVKMFTKAWRSARVMMQRVRKGNTLGFYDSSQVTVAGKVINSVIYGEWQVFILSGRK